MKPEKVVFIEESLKDSFNQLSDLDPVKKGLVRAIRDIQQNFLAGRNVKKNLISRTFIKKYGINNLWIYNLPIGWRMLYSITNTEELAIIDVILDWMSHKDYERLFKF